MASSLLKASVICADPLRHSRSTLARSWQWKVPFVSKSTGNASVDVKRQIVSIAADGTDVSVSRDTEVREETRGPAVSSAKVSLPPRRCSLREFGEGTVAVGSDAKVSNFLDSLAANIEFSYKVQDWEIISGRLAMMVFATAVIAEAITGNSVFDKMDPQRLLEISGAILASIFVAAGFAVALQAKTRVAYSMSKGFERMMNALIDSVFDNLLFDREDS